MHALYPYRPSSNTLVAIRTAESRPILYSEISFLSFVSSMESKSRNIHCLLKALLSRY
jgi:hypothetical protein